MNKSLSQQSETDAKSRYAVGLGWLVCPSASVSFLPITAKFAYQGGSDPTTLLLLRSLIGVVLLAMALAFARQQPALSKRLLWPSFLAGVGAAGFVFGFYNAIQTIDIGMAILIT